jgi:hypothetical protein
MYLLLSVLALYFVAKAASMAAGPDIPEAPVGYFTNRIGDRCGAAVKVLSHLWSHKSPSWDIAVRFYPAVNGSLSGSVYSSDEGISDASWWPFTGGRMACVDGRTPTVAFASISWQNGTRLETHWAGQVANGNKLVASWVTTRADSLLTGQATFRRVS